MMPRCEISMESVDRSRSLTPARGPMISVDVAQMPLEPALEAADHGVGVAALQGERGNHRGVGAHHGARRLRRHAAPAGEFDQQVDIVAIARIVLGIDQRRNRRPA